MNTKTNLGSNITIARKKLKMTQGELCKRVGISRPFLSNVENGIKNPSAETLERIAEALNVRVIELINGFDFGSIEDVDSESRRKDKYGKNIAHKINSINFETMPLSSILLLDETLRFIANNANEDDENINIMYSLIRSIDTMQDAETLTNEQIKEEKYEAFKAIEGIYDKLKR